MVLRMSRPLFVRSYLQVTWWDLGQWKERKTASNDNVECLRRRLLIVLKVIKVLCEQTREANKRIKIFFGSYV